LLRPEEILQLNQNYLIAFLRGMRPILARRIKWYRDPAFRRAAMSLWTAMGWLLAAAVCSYVVWALMRLQ
jgi:type IV secretory pathway TraG/TraD family ATPase VirD4